jgi:hypothetical protein
MGHRNFLNLARRPYDLSRPSLKTPPEFRHAQIVFRRGFGTPVASMDDQRNTTGAITDNAAAAGNQLFQFPRM